MLGDIWYDDISIFPTMPPGIKLSDQHSFRPSNFKGKFFVCSNVQAPHGLMNQLQRRLLRWLGGGGLWLNHVDDLFGECAHQIRQVRQLGKRKMRFFMVSIYWVSGM
jgi:hypothetical protein